MESVGKLDTTRVQGGKSDDEIQASPATSNAPFVDAWFHQFPALDAAAVQALGTLAPAQRDAIIAQLHGRFGNEFVQRNLAPTQKGPDHLHQDEVHGHTPETKEDVPHDRTGPPLVHPVAKTGPITLAPAVIARLQTSFGNLPSFDVTVDPSSIPADARAASDAKHVFLRDAGDAHDLKLLGHEVAHVVQISGDRAPPGLDAAESVGSGGEIASVPVEAHDETGGERKSLEEEADKAAADVEAGRKIETLSTSPISEGDVYLKPKADQVPAKSVRLVLFPGERVVENVMMGRMFVYVNGKLVAEYDAASGPQDASGPGPGGHTAEPTPAGDYTLAAAEHVTTNSWPDSVIPWGAKLRERADHEIEYSSDGRSWTIATGIHGTVTRAKIQYRERTNAEIAAAQNRAHAHDRKWKPVKPQPITDDEKRALMQDVRASMFDETTHKVRESWDQNDFGDWGFDMTQNGKRTQYFVHTTPDDEHDSAAHAADKTQPDVVLTNSHGCVHIKPVDRTEMMAKGFLQAGVKMSVKKYGLVGPEEHAQPKSKNPGLIDL